MDADKLVKRLWADAAKIGPYNLQLKQSLIDAANWIEAHKNVAAGQEIFGMKVKVDPTMAPDTFKIVAAPDHKECAAAQESTKPLPSTGIDGSAVAIPVSAAPLTLPEEPRRLHYFHSEGTETVTTPAMTCIESRHYDALRSVAEAALEQHEMTKALYEAGCKHWNPVFQEWVKRAEQAEARLKAYENVEMPEHKALCAEQCMEKLSAHLRREISVSPRFYSEEDYKTIRSHLARALVDAERYRWLRRNDSNFAVVPNYSAAMLKLNLPAGEALDAAIDDARNRSGEEK